MEHWSEHNQSLFKALSFIHQSMVRGDVKAFAMACNCSVNTLKKSIGRSVDFEMPPFPYSPADEDILQELRCKSATDIKRIKVLVDLIKKRQSELAI